MELIIKRRGAAAVALFVLGMLAGCGPEGGGCEGDACTCEPSGEETCNAVDDDCDGTVDEEAVEAALCDDGIGCTVDVCDMVMGCQHTTSDALCDDSQACTTERCDAVADCVYEADVASCDDGVACTTDTCAPFTGCGHAPSDLACDDGNPCTDDTCSAALGCGHVDNAASCDDGSLCTSGDVCQAGRCVSGAPVVCDDATPCTADACDPAMGCLAPEEPECTYRGPLGGYYEGPYTIVFDVSLGGFVRSMSCEGNARVTVDESRGMQVLGVGEMQCETILAGVSLRQTHSGTAEGGVTGMTADITLRSGRISALWSPTFELDADGVPVRMTGSRTGTVRDVDFADTVGATGTARTSMLIALPNDIPYTLTGVLERVPVPGLCCGPGGCGPLDDYTCDARGHRFLPDGAGECCIGEVCSVATEDECMALSSADRFVPSTQGACCLPDATCDEMPSEACDFFGGAHVAFGACADGNEDGFADLCGPPPSYGRSSTDPASCTLSPDARELTVAVPGAPSIVLGTSTTWGVAGTTYGTSGTVSLRTPLGAIPVPGVSSLDVSCAAPLAISGTGGLPPQAGGIPDFAGIGVPSGPSFALGYAYGYELRAMGIEGPFGDARAYFFAQASTGTSIQVGPGVTIDATPGDELLFAVDTRDPAVIISVAGDLLSTGTGGLVQGLGFGVSHEGVLSIRSAGDLYDGAGFGPVITTGHIYRSGAFPLIPIPGLPVNVVVDGETLVDVGGAQDLVNPIARAVASGDVGPIRDAAGAARVDDVLRGLTVGGNANSLSLDVGPISFEVGAAAFRIDGGGMTFNATSFTPGAELEDGSASLFSAFRAITLQRTQRVYGRVDDSGFGVTIEGDFQAGPFVLRGAAILLDSERGVRIRGGRFEMDFGAFLSQLSMLLDCDFESGVTCSVAGIEVVAFEGRVDDGGFALSGSMGVTGLGRIELGARVGDGGDFTLEGVFERGLPGFNSSRVWGTLHEDGFAIATEWNGIDRRVLISGAVSFDGRFELMGSTSQSVAGFQLNRATVIVNNDALQVDGVLYLLPEGTGLGRNEITALVRVAPFAGEWTLEATGTLEPLGYQLASARIYGSSAIGNRLMFEGRAGAGPVEAQLAGEIVPSPFRISGAGNIRVGDFTLADGMVTIDSSGMSATARMNVLSARVDLMGSVQANGCFSFSSMLDAGLPIGGLSTSIDTRVYLADPRCGTGGSGFLSRRGVIVEGNVDFRVGDSALTARYFLSSSGAFSASTTIGVDVDVDVARLDGEATLRISNSGFDGSVRARVCVDGLGCTRRFSRSFSASAPRIRIDPPGPLGSRDFTLF